jgi:hypothetical protein
MDAPDYFFSTFARLVLGKNERDGRNGLGRARPVQNFWSAMPQEACDQAGKRDVKSRRAANRSAAVHVSWPTMP